MRTLNVGSTLGKYKLEKQISRGGMGQVWLSYHKELDIPVILKVLSPDLYEQDPKFVDRFMREGRLAAVLSHSNIIRIFDAGEEDGHYYLVLEYIDGGNAYELIINKSPLAPQLVIDICIDVCNSLKEANQHGIIHRDIKPHNILMDSRGKVKLADLGIAKKHGDSTNTTFSNDLTYGTPQYIAPEQAIDFKHADHRSDIYSLGASAYHMLTGAVPFKTDSAMLLMIMHVEEDLIPPKVKRPDLDQDISDMICKMMAKDKHDRYQDYDSLLKDLHKIKASFLETAVLDSVKPKQETIVKLDESSMESDDKHSALLLVTMFALTVAIITILFALLKID